MKHIILQNIRYYARFYKLIALAAFITVAVISGSLVLGDSVRTVLVQRVYERLGDTRTLFFSKNAFFSASVTEDTLFKVNGRSANAVLLVNGFISDAGRLLPVFVWGMDDKDIPVGGAKINPTLADALGTNSPELVLRLPAMGMVPSGSLFVTANYTTSARLQLAGIVEAKNGGNINLKAEQTVPSNIFVNRAELADILNLEGKINILMTEKHVTDEEFAKVWNPSLSGIKENYISAAAQHYSNTTTQQYSSTAAQQHSSTAAQQQVEITSERVFIQEDVVNTLCSNNATTNRLFSYLANSIQGFTNGNKNKNGNDPKSIPYSFVTAVDSYKGKVLQEGEVLISDYTATRLHLKKGDAIRLTYYTSADFKTLVTDTFQGRVLEIIPLSELCADKTLSADFPGLSDVENCTDWDSDLPINMDLVTSEDEDYWDKYRTTPKVLIPYTAVAQKWSNGYGTATALRMDAGQANLTGLEASMFGIQRVEPREMGLDAARSGVDFSSLFLSLGFFIILSAMLLLLVPYLEMIYVRRDERALLLALGFEKKRIVRLFWRESAPVVAVASVIGVVAGLFYTRLILLLLETLWNGATHTDGFSVFSSWSTILTGLISGCAISLLVLRTTIVRSVKGKKERLKATHKDKVRLALAPASVRSVPTDVRLIWANLFAGRRRALLSFFTLAGGVFIVFSVGLNRQGFTDSSQLLSGTGGYSLWCETTVPIYHNMATPQGREKLALSDLPLEVRVLQFTRYASDDASCLNLNKVTQPTVLGVDMAQLKDSDFEVVRSIYADNTALFDSLGFACQTNADAPVYPALIDETVLTWGLMLQLGDTISYENKKGQKIFLRIAGTLNNTIFQGNVLIDKKLFADAWSEIAGSEIALVKMDEAEMKGVQQLLSQALNEYGVKVTTTAQRLKEFNSVTDTYLNIFLTLGGLGLLLGIMSFVIVVRKDLEAKREQIALYRALGFPIKKIGQLLQKEAMLVPLTAIFVGALASLLSLSGGLSQVGVWVWMTVVSVLFLLVLGVILFIRRAIKMSTTTASK
ncbi:hypothetical protein FACS1894199_12080 [Bacteroidia bacterium]|nr:hypothetical protein FACS1894199_12080 [Bacteroidia bacterium]